MMDKRSPIQEYFLYMDGEGIVPNGNNVSNEELHELLIRMRNEQFHHLMEQDLLLNIIRNQIRPQFWREVGANILGGFITDGLIYIGKKIL